MRRRPPSVRLSGSANAAPGTAFEKGQIPTGGPRGPLGDGRDHAVDGAAQAAAAAAAAATSQAGGTRRDNGPPATTMSAVSTGRPEAKYVRWMTTTTCPGTPPSARSSSARPGRAPTSSVTLSTITSMAAIRSTTPMPPSGPSSGSITGVRPVTARGSQDVESIMTSPASRNTYFVHITRSPGLTESRSAIAPLASACSLRDSQVPRTVRSACSCRNGVAPLSGRYPDRETRRGTGRSRTYVPEPERPSTRPSAISTLRASSATVSETPYSSRILACDGRRVCGGSEPSTIFLRRSPATRRYAYCSPKVTGRSHQIVQTATAWQPWVVPCKRRPENHSM